MQERTKRKGQEHSWGYQGRPEDPWRQMEGQNSERKQGKHVRDDESNECSQRGQLTWCNRSDCNFN